MDYTYPVSRPSIGPRERELVADAVASGWVSSAGPYIERFERMFADYCGTKYALATSSGTAALHLALLACGVGPGDEVIVPDLTFVATANAVTYTGAKVVLADINPDTLCMDATTLWPRITEHTEAIIPVHLFGHPAITGAGNGSVLAWIEDAAEAHGATINGRRVGGHGDIGCFSFYGNKIITTGEGGMLTTNDPALYAKAFHLRGHAMSAARPYFHETVGYNYRMTNLQAALGCAQMERIDEFLTKRRRIMEWYRDAIDERPGVRLNREAPWAKSANWMVCLEVDAFTPYSRIMFMESLAAWGVETRPYFCPISSMPMYELPLAYRLNDLSIAHRKSQIGLCLPTYTDLTEDDVLRISEIVNGLLDRIHQHPARQGDPLAPLSL
jgi:perosamine synthetase